MNQSSNRFRDRLASASAIAAVFLSTLLPSSVLWAATCPSHDYQVYDQDDLDLLIADLESCDTIEGRLQINSHYSLTNLDGLENLQHIGDQLAIENNNVLVDIGGLQNLVTVGGSVEIRFNNMLPDLDGLIGLSVVENWLQIRFNDSLENLDGFSGLIEVGGGVEVRDNPSLESVEGMNGLNALRDLQISDNATLPNLDGLGNVSQVEFDVSISKNANLASLGGLSGLESLGGRFSLLQNDVLENLDGLENLVSIGQELFIERNQALKDCSAVHKLINGLDDGVAGPGDGDSGDPDVAYTIRFTDNALGCRTILEARGPVPFKPGSQIAMLPDGGLVVAGDLDLNGTVDLLVGGEDGGVQWLENAGPDANWAVHTVAASFDARHLALADLDGDGDLDAIGGPESGSVTWWKNPRNSGAWPENALMDDSVPPDPVSGVFGVAAGDLDGDGDQDIVAANGDLQWWENTNGDASSWAFHALGMTAVFRPALVDFDQDGDMDIVAAGGAGPDSIVIYLNSGEASSFVPQLLVDDLDFPVSDVRPADMNGDGILDVVASMGASDSSGGALAWFEADGARYDIDVDLFRNQYSSIHDMDGDGDLDVLASSGVGWPSPGQVNWFENVDGQGVTWYVRSLGELGGSSQVIGADLDRDGDFDVISASAGEIVWFGNDSIHWSARFPLEEPTVGAGTAYETTSFGELADIDLDGDTDVVLVKADGFHWLENNLDGRGPCGGMWCEEAIAGVTDAQAFALGDIDRDGDLDVVGVGAANDVTGWWENGLVGGSSCGFSWCPGTITESLVDPRGIVAADFDGDGDPDVAVAAIDDGLAWVSNGLGEGTACDNDWCVNAIDDSRSLQLVRAADVNQDGLVDIVTLAANGDLDWWSNELDRTDAGECGADWCEFMIDSVAGIAIQQGLAVGDIDGDGDVDVVRGRDVITWLENSGAGAGWTEHTVGGIGASRVALRDFDNDGDLDIGATGDDEIRWYDNNLNGKGHCGTDWCQEVEGTASQLASIIPGDLDGNGRADLVQVTASAPRLRADLGGSIDLLTTAMAPGVAAGSQILHIFDIQGKHAGRLGDRDVMVDSVEVAFETEDGTALSYADFFGLFGLVTLYRDDPLGPKPGEFDVYDDWISNYDYWDLDLVTGVLEVDVGNMHAEQSRIVYSEAPVLYFLTAYMNDLAAYHSVDAFRVKLRSGGATRGLDPDRGMPLDIRYFEDVETAPIEVWLGNDLYVTVSNSSSGVPFGEPVEYHIYVRDRGPNAVNGAVLSTQSAGLAECHWTCSANTGASCGQVSGDGTPSDAFSIDGSDLEYLVSCIGDAANVEDMVSLSAEIVPPSDVIELNPDDNQFIDTDMAKYVIDVSANMDAGDEIFASGEQVNYTVTVRADSDYRTDFDANDIRITSPIPEGLENCSWTCDNTPEAYCHAPVAGTGALGATANITNGASLGVFYECDVEADFVDADISSSVSLELPDNIHDPYPSNNQVYELFSVTSCGESYHQMLNFFQVYFDREEIACDTIQAFQGHIRPGGSLSLTAGKNVSLGPSFRVEKGGQLAVTIEPSLASE